MDEDNDINQDQEEKDGNSKSEEKLPVLLDVIFDLSNLIIVFVPLAVAGISFVSGASVLDIALRAGVSLIIVAIFLIIVTRKIVDMSIDVTNRMLERATNTGTNVDQQG
jgi:hypothetical protein